MICFSPLKNNAIHRSLIKTELIHWHHLFRERRKNFAYVVNHRDRTKVLHHVYERVQHNAKGGV
jgi:hypothetical protein